ncbi:MAG TPA: hypothetical protein VGC13_27930 [Longimicrobium sp.]|jgi:hypothetical protein|uniref:hypothetical protein n=1 Tax=Longimicrobium sp. TaxID=2029185 RepID=UPI002EDA5D43
MEKRCRQAAWTAAGCPQSYATVHTPRQQQRENGRMIRTAALLLDVDAIFCRIRRKAEVLLVEPQR